MAVLDWTLFNEAVVDLEADDKKTIKCLNNKGEYVDFWKDSPTEEKVTLAGRFTVKELAAIMRTQSRHLLRKRGKK